MGDYTALSLRPVLYAICPSPWCLKVARPDSFDRRAPGPKRVSDSALLNLMQRLTGRAIRRRSVKTALFSLSISGWVAFACICRQEEFLRGGLHNRKELSDATPGGQSISLLRCAVFAAPPWGPIAIDPHRVCAGFFFFWGGGFPPQRFFGVVNGVCWELFVFIQLLIHLLVYSPYLKCADTNFCFRGCERGSFCFFCCLNVCSFRHASTSGMHRR